MNLRRLNPIAMLALTSTFALSGCDFQSKSDYEVVELESSRVVVADNKSGEVYLMDQRTGTALAVQFLDFADEKPKSYTHRLGNTELKIELGFRNNQLLVSALAYPNFRTTPLYAPQQTVVPEWITMMEGSYDPQKRPEFTIKLLDSNRFELGEFSINRGEYEMPRIRMLNSEGEAAYYSYAGSIGLSLADYSDIASINVIYRGEIQLSEEVVDRETAAWANPTP